MKRKEFVAKMRDILRKRRDALRNVLHGELSELTKRDTGVGDALDFANESDSDEIRSQLAAAESRELANIEYALERLKKGRYGVCEGCDSDIPSARLQALPYATHCVRCQRHAELNQATDARRFDWSSLGSRDEVEEPDHLSLNNVESEMA